MVARSKGTGKRFIVGFKDGGTYEIKRQTWVPIQARLKLKRSLPIGVQEEIIGATRSYVLEVRSQVSETSGNLLEVLHKWLDDTRTLRNQIWMQKQSTTEETGAVGLLRLKDVYALDESGVLRSGLDKIGGDSRHTLAIAAVGFDYAMLTCSYAIQLLKDEARGLQNPLLWNLWVAQIYYHVAPFANDPHYNPRGRSGFKTRFNNFVAGLQDTLPMECTKYVRQALEKEARLSIEFSKMASPNGIKAWIEFLARHDRLAPSTRKPMKTMVRTLRRLKKLKKLRNAKGTSIHKKV